MKANQLLFENLIDFNPEIGEIKFKDTRMSLVSVEAQGLLHRDLINTLGMERAKGFLMRYGWACGMRDGEIIASMYEWESMEELMLAGPIIHTLLGVVVAKPDKIEINDQELYFSGTWKDSYESINHVKDFGVSKHNGCWTLQGYASGYLTKTLGKDVIAYETECVGRGDATCRFVARTVDSFDRQAELLMRYYKSESIATELDRAQKELQEINQNIIESDLVNQNLIAFLAEDRELNETVKYIAETINKSIVIDYYNKIIESAFLSERDETSYQNWTDKFIYKEEEKSNIRTFPIRTNNINLGRLVVISLEKMTHRDELILNRALGFFTIQLHHQWKITQSLWKSKENFFEEMLNNPDQESLDKHAHLFDFNPNEGNRVISIIIKPNEKMKDVMHFLQMKDILTDTHFFRRKNNIVIMLSGNAATKPKEFINAILKDLNKEFQSMRFYLGVGRETNNLQDLIESYRDARSICKFILLTNPVGNHIAYYEDLEPIMMFLKGTNQKELIDFYKKTIGSLIQHDYENETDYVMTLKAYLDFNGNLQQTADNLHLSIAGLRYRIERIESICAINLKTGDGRFKCHLALQIYFAMTIHSERRQALSVHSN